MSAARPGVPSGPLESAPRGFVPVEERSAFLAGVLDGVGLGACGTGGSRAGWPGWSTSTTLTIASWILRAREAGQER